VWPFGVEALDFTDGLEDLDKFGNFTASLAIFSIISERAT